LETSFTPALCATLLRPDHLQPNFVFRWFNRMFDGAKTRYQRAVAHILGRAGRYLLIYFGLASQLLFLLNSRSSL